MPIGFKRFRLLNESGTTVNATGYSAHSDWGGGPESIIAQEDVGPPPAADPPANITQNTLHSFQAPGGPQGIPGVLAVRANIDIGGAGGPPEVHDWLLAPSWEGSEILEVDITVTTAGAGLLATARIFLTEDYYEERLRYF